MMKKMNILLFAVILCCFLLNSCSSQKPVINEDNLEKRIYEVFGMDCPACQGGLEKLLKKNSNISHTEANWENKNLIIYIKQGAQVSDEEIHKIIEQANFTPGKRLK